MAMKAPDLRYQADSTVTLEDGRSIYVERHSGPSGPCLVFINNFYIVAPMWRTYLTEVTRRYDVLLYDLENQGGSSPEVKPTIDHHVETLRRLVETVVQGPVVLVGTSTSCLIAARYAQTYPDHVAGLVLIGPSLTPSAEPVRRATERALMTSLRLGGTEALWDHLYSVVFTARTMIELGAAGYLGLRTAFMALHRQEPMLANMHQAASEQDDFAQLAGLRMPVRVVVGDKDTLWQGDQVQEARALLTGKHQSVEVLDGLGHLPYLEDADAFQRSLLGFVEALQTGHETGRGPSILSSEDGEHPDEVAAQEGDGSARAVSVEGVAAVLAGVLEHDVPMKELMTQDLADVGVESWAFTAFLARLEEVFQFTWDFDVPAETFASCQTIAEHMAEVLGTTLDRSALQ